MVSFYNAINACVIIKVYTAYLHYFITAIPVPQAKLCLEILIRISDTFIKQFPFDLQVIRMYKAWIKNVFANALFSSIA